MLGAVLGAGYRVDTLIRPREEGRHTIRRTRVDLQRRKLYFL